LSYASVSCLEELVTHFKEQELEWLQERKELTEQIFLAGESLKCEFNQISSQKHLIDKLTYEVKLKRIWMLHAKRLCSRFKRLYFFLNNVPCFDKTSKKHNSFFCKIQNDRIKP